ncbi:MAG TPA: hypothetical protein VKV04_09470 [Verrucomicrobiae bacterium]|nr:hypothetical protein [Verrucomicrobiae bacterium]
MKTTIDIKSAVLGLAIGIVAMLAIGAEESPSNPVGRYQVQTCPGNPSGFAVLVDTTTGKVWMGNGSGNQLRSDLDFFAPKPN